MLVEQTTQDEIDLGRRSTAERVAIARRVGRCLGAVATAADDRAARELARQLAADAVLLVREALSEAVRHNRFLPVDVARRIAHDVESVAQPFLEVTEVFDEHELSGLVTTLCDSSRAVLAGRGDMPPQIIRQLAEVGGPETAEALCCNTCVQLRPGELATLCERFAQNDRVTALLQRRTDLPLAVMERLVARASEVASEKLTARYGDEPGITIDYVYPIGKEAGQRVADRLVHAAPEGAQQAYAADLYARDRLSARMVAEAAERGRTGFVLGALAAMAAVPIENVRKLVCEGGPIGHSRLLEKAGIDAPYHGVLADALGRLAPGLR